MKIWGLRIAILFVIVVAGVGPALAGGTQELVLDAGPYTGTRADDGTSELQIDATNLTDERTVLRLATVDDSCEPADGEPALDAFTSGTLTFTMDCEPGSAPRSATVSSPALAQAITLTFTLEPATIPQWTPMLRFLAVVPFAALAVVVPFLYWRQNPMGNPAEGVAAAGPLPWKGLFFLPLPGITKDWSLSENWASSVTLGGGLFTAFFASSDLLPSILGEASAAQSKVVVAAAALSAALVAAGPLWLTILKRRTATMSGVSRDNTVAGVLMSSAFVLVGAFGGIWVIAAVVGSGGAVLAATAVSGLLLLYTAKSIPQTLALGLYGEQSSDGGQRVVAASL